MTILYLMTDKGSGTKNITPLTGMSQYEKQVFIEDELLLKAINAYEDILTSANATDLKRKAAQDVMNICGFLNKQAAGGSHESPVNVAGGLGTKELVTLMTGLGALAQGMVNESQVKTAVSRDVSESAASRTGIADAGSKTNEEPSK